jgi:small subunit ribosomal protein S6
MRTNANILALSRVVGPLVRGEEVKLMNKYETIYIIRPTVDEAGVKTIVAKFKGIIEANGEIETLDEWGKRKLAYLIDDIGEGYYVYTKYKADTAVPKELDRVFGITEDILRNMTIRLD